jgi:putative acetyltransferase
LSPIKVDGADVGWFGLGPVAVRPDLQGRGIGRALVDGVLGRARSMGAAGCVVLGDPAYYARFGFRPFDGLHYPGPPAEYFQALTFRGEPPSGTVAYHPAFG